MQIKIEKIANKRICNFSPETAMFADESLFCAAANVDNLQDGLLKNILQITGVKRCLITKNTISVKYDEGDFEQIKALVLAEIDDALSEKQIIMRQNTLDMQETSEALADAFIRPTLNRDNGDIEIKVVNAESMELKFTGHCAGCPYAQNTLQNLVLKIFHKYLPQMQNIYVKENT